MDKKAIFVRTQKGDDEVQGKTRDLAGDDKRTLPMVDGKAKVGEIRKRVAPSLRDNLDATLAYLVKHGYIHDKDKKPAASAVLKKPSPVKTTTSITQEVDDEDAGELDFMSGFTPSAPQAEKTPQTEEAEENLVHAEAEAEKLKQEAEAAKRKADEEAKKIKDQAQAAKLKAEAEAKKLKEAAEAEAQALIKSKQAVEAEKEKAKKEAEAIRLKAEQEAQKLRDELAASKIKAEQAAKQQLEAAAKARQQAEEARIKAEQEAERMRAELEATKRKAEEEARIKAEQEAKRKAEEEARLKAEEEARLKAEEEARLKAEQEAKRQAEEEARLKAEEEARLKAEEEARLKAEQEAKRKAEEEARLKAEEEARLKAEEEARIKAEQEAKRKAEEEARLKAEEEARRKAEEEARIKAEQEAKRKAEEEARLKAEEEARLKAEEEAQIKAELEAAKLKAELEAKARLEAEARAHARMKAEEELEARRKAEEEAQLMAEEEARRKAEEEARLKAEEEARLRAEEEARLKAEQEATLKAEEEARIKAEVDARLKAKEEERLKAEEEARLKAEEEARIKAEVDARLKAKEEEARLKAEKEARLKAEEEARLKAEEEAKLKAEEEARIKAEQEAKRKAEEEARLKAEEEARLKAEEEARIKAEQEAKRKAEEEARLKAEEEARCKAEEEARIKAEQEAKRKAEEEARLKAEEEARLKAEEEARIKAEEEAKIKAEEEALKQARQEASRKPHTEAVVVKSKPDTFAFGDFDVDEPQASDSKAAANLRQESVKDEHTSSTSQTQHDTEPDRKAVKAEHAETTPAPAQASPPPVDHAQAKKEQKAREDAAQVLAAAEKRAAEEAQAKKIADEQNKTWAEAEQRSLETAKANAEKASQQDAVNKKPAKIPAKVKKSSSPFPWGQLMGLIVKLGIVLIVLLVGALFAVPSFLPMRDYMPQVEKIISDSLNQPVHIGSLSGQILPTPRLEIGEIYIGKGKQLQLDRAHLNFSFSSLMQENKPIDSIEIENFKVSGKSIQEVSGWFQTLAANKQYPTTRMRLHQGTLDADVFKLIGIEGDIHFDSKNQFNNMSLLANSGKYTIDINATPESKLQIELSAKGIALPLLPNWKFDEVTAKGELNSNQLIISEFDGRLFGGSIKGDSRITWRTNWQAQGNITAKTINLNHFNELLVGNFDGDAYFKMNSPELGGLTDSSRLDGSFTTNKGTINGVDIVETARLRSKDHLPGGRTHFDKMLGSVSFVNNIYYFEKVRIKTDVLNSTASIVVQKDRLSGSMEANLKIQDNATTTNLEISGTLDRPQLHTAQ